MRTSAEVPNLFSLHNDLAKIEALKQIAKQRYGSSKKQASSNLMNGGVLAQNLEHLARVTENQKRLTGGPTTFAFDDVHRKSRPIESDLHHKGSVAKNINYLVAEANKKPSVEKGVNPFENSRPTAHMMEEFLRQSTQSEEETTDKGNPKARHASVGHIRRGSDANVSLMGRSAFKSRNGVRHKHKKASFIDASEDKGASILDLKQSRIGVSHDGEGSDFSEEDELISVAGELEESFQRRLVSRAVAKERLENAAILTRKMDEEYREQMRQNWEQKEERWRKAMEKLKKLKEKKKSDTNEIKKFRHELKAEKEKVKY